MNNLDFEIYKQINPNKGLTEIYLGYVVFPWYYAKADYSADRTQGIAFDIFEKVICKLIDVDSSKSILELGNILGMNIEDNESEGKYRDLAEYEMLSEKIQQLEEDGLLESNSKGGYDLTNAGKEAVKFERKFRTIQNDDFSLYYDLIGDQNTLAGEAFRNLERIPSHFEINYDFNNEENIKTFSNYQIPGIYCPEEGNSFSNLVFKECQKYEIPVYFGVIYDFLKKEYRLVSYNCIGQCNLYEEAIKKNWNLKDKILQAFLKSQEESAEGGTELQLEFENEAIKIQKQIEEYKTRHEQDITLDCNEYKKSEKFIVPEAFWNEEDLINLTSESKKVCFCVDTLTSEIITRIQRISYKNCNTKFFLAFYQKDDNVKIEETDNLYICQTPFTNTNKIMCTIEDKAKFSCGQFVYSYREHLYKKDVIIHIDTEIDGKELFDIFVSSWLPKYFSDFRNVINEDLTGKEGISRLTFFDTEMENFIAYIEELNLLDDYNEINSLKNQKIKSLKREHEKSLIEELLKIESENKESLARIESLTIEDIEETKKNQDTLKSITEKVSVLEKHSDNDYIELNKQLNTYKATLQAKGKYIEELRSAKMYVIDTNVFLDDENILSKIKLPNIPVVTATVIEELDYRKNDSILGGQARKAINKILQDENVRFALANPDKLPPDFLSNLNDNKILSAAIEKNDKGYNVCLLTSDKGLGVKAKFNHIPKLTLKEFNKQIVINNENRK